MNSWLTLWTLGDLSMVETLPSLMVLFNGGAICANTTTLHVTAGSGKMDLLIIIEAVLAYSLFCNPAAALQKL